MKTESGPYEIDSDFERIQFDRVHSWLTETYWSPGVSYENVIRAARNSSLAVGAYYFGIQVGYARIVSDRTTFAWVCDVYVSKEHRAKGLARSMLSLALADSEHQNLRRWLLATKDAHGVYRELNFELIRAPERWMVRGSNPSSETL